MVMLRYSYLIFLLCLKEEILQDKAADALAKLISYCVMRRPGPVEKLVKNICSLTWMDPPETPQVASITSMEAIEEQDLLSLKSSTRTQKSRVRLPAGSEDSQKSRVLLVEEGQNLL
ncbi:btaf1 RNA polymerase II, B-TFIID transcription factor-associated, 170kDa [Dionaea muscipula]